MDLKKSLILIENSNNRNGNFQNFRPVYNKHYMLTECSAVHLHTILQCFAIRACGAATPTSFNLNGLFMHAWAI